MKKDELKEWGFINEEQLSFSDRLKLTKMTKGKVEPHVIKMFNKQPQFLRDYEKVYFAKYLGDNYTFYSNDSDIYVGPTNATIEQYKEYFIPEDAERKIIADVYKDNGIGYKNLRVYSVVPGVKYKMLKGRGLTGYPSFDKPWLMQSEEYVIKQNNLFEFFVAGRNKFFASEEAFRCYDQEVSWTEFKNMVEKYTKALAANNIVEDDTVAVCTQSIIEAVALFFATTNLGAKMVYMDPDNTSSYNINKKFKELGVKIVFTTPQYANEIVAAGENTKVEKNVILSPAKSLKKCDNLSDYSKEYLTKIDVPYQKKKNVIDDDDFINEGLNYTGPIKYSTDISKVCLYTSTSGSTGEPKLVELTKENIMYEMMYLKRSTHLDLGPKGINMQVVSFKYPYGFVISTLVTLYAGKTSGLCPDITPKNYLNFIKMYNPKYIHAIPSFFKNMVEDPNVGDLSNLEFAVSGGDFYDAVSIDKCNKFFRKHGSKAKIKNGFGSAEATACVTAATVGKYNYESVGKPLVGVNVKVLGDNGMEMPYDHIGNICYTGKNVMKGYFNDEESTAEVKFTGNDGKEWLLTDAIGFVDREGFVYVCDRERNLFITYGDSGAAFKVYPNFVRLIINTCEGVDDCLVVKQPNASRDLVPYAFVTIKDGYDHQKVLEEVRKICALKLDKCAVPVSFDVVDKLKVKSSDKVDVQYYEELAASKSNFNTHREGLIL